MKSYDIAIIGAGIAGCTLAYLAKKRGLKVLIIDKANTPATGGSSAAGAFISPKLGKNTPLLELTNRAYLFSINFYKSNFSEYFNQTGIIRLPKNSNDAKEFIHYKQNIGGILLNKKELEKIMIQNEDTALYFKEAGVCDAQNLCNALIKEIDFLQQDIKNLNDIYNIAKNIILTTGYEGFNNLDYMGINGVWGSRGDFYCDSKINISMHKKVSISANINGIIKIGATHVRVKKPSDVCLKCNGEPLNSLIKEASQMIQIKNLKIKKIFCGMRAGSRDYTPLVGKVIDTNYMIKNYPKLKKGFSRVKFKYIPNLFILNGLGGRGFVLAPLMAKYLLDYIIENQAIDKRVNPDRLFLKWVRKLK